MQRERLSQVAMLRKAFTPTAMLLLHLHSLKLLLLRRWTQPSCLRGRHGSVQSVMCSVPVRTLCSGMQQVSSTAAGYAALHCAVLCCTPVTLDKFQYLARAVECCSPCLSVSGSV